MFNIHGTKIPQCQNPKMHNVRICRTVDTNQCGQRSRPAGRRLSWETENAIIQWTVLPNRTWTSNNIRKSCCGDIDLWQQFNRFWPSFSCLFDAHGYDPSIKRCQDGCLFLTTVLQILAFVVFGAPVGGRFVTTVLRILRFQTRGRFVSTVL